MRTPKRRTVCSILLLAAVFCPHRVVAQQRNDSSPALYARIVMLADPVRLEPSRNAPIVGIVFHGMSLPITGKITTCEWLKVKLPPTLSRFGDEGWIVGPPEFALIDGGGCTDIPDVTPRPPPVGRQVRRRSVAVGEPGGGCDLRRSKLCSRNKGAAQICAV